MKNLSTASLLDNPILSGGYFYPWPNRFEDPYFVEGDGFRLGCRYRRISAVAPTMIHFHGNGETVADYVGDFEERIAGLEVNLLLVEYRGYGMSSGAPALVAMLADVELIVRAAEVDPQRIIFFGRSLGSLYAVHGAGLFPQAAGLILESGIADPLERTLARVEPWQLGTDLAGLQQAVDRDLNQRSKLGSFRGRTLVMHTLYDGLVAVSHAEKLFEWANEPKELLIFERGDHNTILPANEAAYFTALEDFFRMI
jgi:uncharacterized protein